jgi:hypothetical protein
MICSKNALALSVCLLLWASTSTEAWNHHLSRSSNKPAFAARQAQQQRPQRVMPKPILMSATKLGMASPADLEYNSDRIRNFSIIAHIDHGAYYRCIGIYRQPPT